jgi:hypothetical protein
MVTDKAMEGAMAAAISAGRARSSWILWSFWLAGVGLLLVELNAATEYLQASLQQNMGNLGFLPALAMITFKVAERSASHWGTLGPLLQGVPVAVLGLLLVAIGVAASAQFARTNGKSAKQ